MNNNYTVYNVKTSKVKITFDENGMKKYLSNKSLLVVKIFLKDTSANKTEENNRQSPYQKSRQLIKQMCFSLRSAGDPVSFVYKRTQFSSRGKYTPILFLVNRENVHIVEALTNNNCEEFFFGIEEIRNRTGFDCSDVDIWNVLAKRMLYTKEDGKSIEESIYFENYCVYVKGNGIDPSFISTKDTDAETVCLSCYVNADHVLMADVQTYFTDGSWNIAETKGNNLNYGLIRDNKKYYLGVCKNSGTLSNSLPYNRNRKSSVSINTFSAEASFGKEFAKHNLITRFNDFYSGICQIECEEWECYKAYDIETPDTYRKQTLCEVNAIRNSLLSFGTISYCGMAGNDLNLEEKAISDNDRVFEALDDVLHMAVYAACFPKTVFEKMVAAVSAIDSDFKLHFETPDDTLSKVIVYCESKKSSCEGTKKEKAALTASSKNKYTVIVPANMMIKSIRVSISNRNRDLNETTRINIDFIHGRKRQTYSSRLTYYSGYGLPEVKLQKKTNYKKISAKNPVIVTIQNDNPDLKEYKATKNLNTQHISALSLYQKKGNSLSYKKPVNDKGWVDYHLAMMGIKCLSELCIKMDITNNSCVAPNGTYIWIKKTGKKEFRYFGITCRDNQSEYKELSIGELEEMVTYSPSKQDAYIVIPEGFEDTPFIIERTDITPAFVYETNDEDDIIPFCSRAKNAALEAYPGFVDFSFSYRYNDLFYAVAPILATYQKEIAKYPHFYKVSTDDHRKIDESLLSPDDLIAFLKRATLTVSGYTTLPYPFKYLREWVNYYQN